MNIIELVEYLNQELLTKMSDEENKEELSRLGQCLYKLSESAQHCNDTFLQELFDDMNYVVNETIMGARVKGEMMIPSIRERMKNLR